MSQSDDSKTNNTAKNNQAMIGDLEQLKDFLDDESESASDSSLDLSNIPTLDTPITPTPRPATTQPTTQPITIRPSTPPKQNNPFIPYDAINRLKHERQSIRNFAAEAIEAAKQGLDDQHQLNNFDLFKYSEQSKASSLNTTLNTSLPSSSDEDTQQPTLKSPSTITPPDTDVMNAIIDDIIADQLPKIEIQLRKHLEDYFDDHYNIPSKK